MENAPPNWFAYVFWGLAGIASFFYAFCAFGAFCVVFDDPKHKPGPAFWIHQCWFNFAGSLVGWTAAWFMILKLWTYVTIGGVEFGWSEVGLGALAFVGVTGHLPLATKGLLEGLAQLALKVIGASEGSAKSEPPKKERVPAP